MAFEYLKENVATNIVGSFANKQNEEFNKNLHELTESFKSVHSLDIWDAQSFKNALTNSQSRQEYKNILLGDVLESSVNDEWFDMHAQKLEQLFENTIEETITESALGQMSPIVGYTLPILKKNYYENISKELMMTEVPDQPFVRIAFERAFLKDAAGTKFYIPEVFYDNSYKEIVSKTKGTDIKATLEAKLKDGSLGADALNLPLQDFSVLNAVGGSMQARDTLAFDFEIDSVKVERPACKYYVPLKLNPAFDNGEVENTTSNPRYIADVDSPLFKAGQANDSTLAADEFIVKGVSMQPNYANGGSLMGKIRFEGKPHDRVTTEVKDASNTAYEGRVYGTDTTVKMYDDTLFGQVDQYLGSVTIAPSAKNVIKSVMFGGHLSNENNVNTAEIDYERETREWKIPDGERLNAGVKHEHIKDSKALLNVDITAKIIADMTKVMTEIEDSTCLDFVDDSYATWREKKDLPFGYGNHVSKGSFIEEASFSCIPPAGVVKLQSEWIHEQLKFQMDRLFDQLNKKLYNKSIMYVVFGNPAVINLLNDKVKWVVSNDTKVGGVQLEYNFGVLTNSQVRVHVVSSNKVREEAGIRILAYPTSNDTITFKHFKYSFVIDNQYRNPLTPLTPNVMCTQRYKYVELTPVQGRMKLTNNGFGNLNPVGVQGGEPGYVSRSRFDF